MTSLLLFRQITRSKQTRSNVIQPVNGLEKLKPQKHQQCVLEMCCQLLEGSHAKEAPTVSPEQTWRCRWQCHDQQQTKQKVVPGRQPEAYRVKVRHWSQNLVLQYGLLVHEAVSPFTVCKNVHPDGSHLVYWSFCSCQNKAEKDAFVGHSSRGKLWCLVNILTARTLHTYIVDTWR